MASKSKKMSKAEMASLLARCLNLLNSTHGNEDGFSQSDTNEFNRIVAALPEAVVEATCFWNNGTVTVNDLL